MRNLYKILFLFVLVNFNSSIAYSLNIVKVNEPLKTIASPSGQITGNATVCLNSTAPIVKFEVIDDNGKEPYKFSYTINGVAQTPVSTTGSNKSITVPQPTNVANTFIYILTGIKDKDNNDIAVSNSLNTVVINVNPLPVVDFTFTDNQCSGSSVQFTTTNVGSSNTWNFGDGSTSTSQNPTHVFNNTNGNSTQSFNVTLTVTDANGCINKTTKAVHIQNPDTSLNSDAVSDIYNGYKTFRVCSNTVSEIQFINASTTLATNSNYSINWGDSTPDFTSTTFSTTSHTYSVGLWTLTYTVKGQNGCSISRIYKVFVGNNPAVGIGNPGNTNICNSTPLTFPITGTENNPPGTIYTITFNDGSAPLTFNHPPPASVTHTFLKSSCGITSNNGSTIYQNSFSANIEASNPCDISGGSVVPIRVSMPPIVNFTIPQPIVCTNNSICLTNTTTGGAIPTNTSCGNPKLIWSIFPSTGFTLTSGTLGSDNNGSSNTNTWTSGTNDICPVFNLPGTYTITLKVGGNSCSSDQITKTICVEAPLTPQFTLNNISGCSSQAITATNTTDTTNSCSPPTYLWSVAFVPSSCGTVITAIPNQTTTNAAFNFTEAGIYTIKLTATNSCTPSQLTTKTVTITKPPIVTITPIASLCQTLPTTTISPTAMVVNCGTQSPLTYAWSFPGGTPVTSAMAVPGPISYSTTGTFTVSLTVSNECGPSNTATQQLTVSPSPTITGTLFSCINSTSQLTGSATAAATSPWTSSLIGVATVSSTGLVTGVSAGTTTITYTNSNGCKTTALFTVNPTPIVTFSILNQTICSGDTSSIVTLSSVPGATFNWTAVQPTGISGVILNGTNTIPSQALVNSTNANIIVIYNATATLASGATCAGAVFPYTITVKPKPFIAAIMTATSCSGLPFNVTPTNGAGNSIPTGTTYSWIAPVVTGGLTGGNAGTNQTSISGTLTNPTNSVQTATYSVTPSFNGCSGSAFDLVVTVNPKPDVTTTPNVILCNGETSLPINFTGTVIGTTYTWSSSTTSIGIAINGTNSIPSFNAINTGTTPIIATITVIPSANSCSGPSKTFTITVNPTPTVNSITNLIKCNGVASGTLSFTGSVTGTTFDWTNDTPTIGLAGSGSGNIASFATINNGLTPIIATITVTPKANGCIGTPITFTIIVNPTPTVDLPLNQIVCNGQQTTAIFFTGAISNTTYNWTNNNSTIGLGAIGVGDIPAFTAINNGTSPIVANIAVTPNVNSCPGASKTFTITINPSPGVTFSPTNQIICSGSSSAVVNLSSTAAGTNFTWTAALPAGITGVIQNGTNTIPVQTLTNSTNIPIVVTYLATAESTSGVSCQGITYPYTITVNPVPSITTSQAQTICSNTSFSVLPLDGAGNSVPVATTYSWGTPVVTGGISGGVALSNQTTIKGTLINPTDAVQTATYAVTPKSGTCNGTSFTVVVTVNPAPKVLFSGANQFLCSAIATLPITLSSPTTGNITFNWTATIPAGINGATASGTDTIPTQTLVNTTIAPLTVIYTATATLDTNGVLCTGQPLDYKITVNPAIITSSILSNYSGFNVSAVGVSDGSINVTVTGGSGAYTYLWSGQGGFSASSQDLSNVPAGAYSLIINDGLCSPITLDFVLTSPMPLLIQEDVAAHLDLLCFGYSTGVLKVDITQQSVGPYDYLLTLQEGGTISNIINSAATTYTFTDLAAGIYDIKVTDANGSVKIIPGVIITQPSGITASISAQTNVNCAGDATGSATVTASGGIGTLLYSWNTIPIQTTATATGLTAGTYTVTITDANTCSLQKQAIIIEPNAIVTSISSQTNVLCFGNNTGSATVSASGGTGILSYSWDTVPVQTTATATGLVAGTYTLTVSDTKGCQKVQTVIITQPTGGLSSTISNSTNVSCFGENNGSATATVSGGTAPYYYSWNTVPVQTLATATGLKAGNYSVSISDLNGCSTSTSVTITEPLGMAANITAQTNVFCSGNSTGSATVTATGGTLPYDYSWNTTPVQTSDVAVNLPIGTYTVTITDAKGCTTTAQAIITEPNGIVTTIASQTNVDCFGNSTGAVSILASGGAGTLSYSWDTNPVQTTPSLVVLIAGTYNLTVTDANNCTKVQAVTITQPDDIVISTDLEKDVSCYNAANGEIKITISGGTLNYTYAWTKNGIAYATTEDLSNLSPGVYQASVSDANNCGPKTATFTITEPLILAVGLVGKTDVLCYGQSTGVVNVNVVGGTSPYTYAWSGPNGFASSNPNLANVFAGTYNLVVTDNLGCTKTLSVTLTQPTAINITATTTPIICYGANNASISIAISGGIAPYDITWSNLGSGTFQDNLSAGDYLVTVTDTNNCVQTLNVNIPEAPIFTINPVVKNITCFGDKNGSINLNIVGGIAPVKLVWDDSTVAGTTRNNLGPGSYTVTITDSKPCTIKRTFIILEPQLLVLSANVTNAFDCFNANTGAINLLVSGGSAPFTYSWSNGATTEDLSNIPGGNYLVTVKDVNGCSQQTQYNINRPPPIVTSVETKTDFNCETKYVKQTFVAQVSGGVPPYQLVWSSGTVSGPNNELMNTSQNGTVILNATDAIGCKSNYTFTVAIPKLGTPSFDSSSYAYSTYGMYSINDPIQFTNTATGDYISMIWDFGDGSVSTELNPVHTFINPKNYVVTQTVTYPLGCVYVQKITFIIGKGYVLVVPTAFTPNNDSLNDTFRPVTKGLKKVRLDIYDTWGSMIYSESGDVLRGWDGKIKDSNSENGNYYCKVSGETFYGTIVNENHPFVLIK
ncbi:PKD-like domain-containing protein [Flavobacterium soyangense]|uniref:PKD domain-containing protein n=1 Tax=Flavobacterium soyangense TaxID=2023265 RepID=A0A930XX12_9FLAO|nr:PKD-like domain-containing protein [Flavobacterium soyangense]MBF2709757.1 PKD domain-containing protein [Flavobacterium soyangense]